MSKNTSTCTNTRTRKYNLFSAIAAVAILAACTQDSTTNPVETLKPLDILIDWQAEPTYLGIYYAKEAGYFETAGFDVTITQSWGANQAVAAIANGKHTIGTASGGATVLGRNNDANVISLGVLYPKIPSVVYGLQKSQISSPQDLKGKKVGIYPGSITANEFDAFLSLNQLTKEQVEIVSLSGADIPYLLSDKVDAVLHYTEMSPVLVETTVKLEDGSTPQTFELKLSEHGVGGYGLNVIANENAFENDPEKLFQINDIIAKGYNEGCKNKDKAVTSFTELFPDKDISYVSASWGRVCSLVGENVGAQTLQGWQETIDLYQDLGLLKVEIDPSELLGQK